MKLKLEGTITITTLIKYFEGVLDDGYGHEAAIANLLKILRNLEK